MGSFDSIEQATAAANAYWKQMERQRRELENIRGLVERTMRKQTNRIRQLEEENERLRAMVDDCERDHPPEPWASELKAENERLRAKVRELP
ncbi:MAG: hypothetical protein PVI87_10770 [Gammaproteobacteria bacterium]|jgi:predicted RNase H-like nuclease (RuvC/YqgF family)